MRVRACCTLRAGEGVQPDRQSPDAKVASLERLRSTLAGALGGLARGVARLRAAPREPDALAGACDDLRVALEVRPPAFSRARAGRPTTRRSGTLPKYAGRHARGGGAPARWWHGVRRGAAHAAVGAGDGGGHVSERAFSGTHFLVL